MADRFEDLKTFVTVVDCGGINAAADRLAIAKSAVSRRLSELEARLKVQLIERTTRSFRVTAIGQDYFAKAKRLMDAWDEMDAGTLGASTGETLVIAGPAGLLTHLIVPAAAAMSIGSDLPPMKFQRPSEREAAVTFTIEPAGSGKDGLGLLNVTRMVFAAPAYLERAGPPLRLQDLLGRVGIAVESAGSADWTFGRGARHRPQIVLTAPDEGSALAAAIGGAGLVQLDAFVAEPAIRRGDLTAVLEEHSPPPHIVTARLAELASASARRFVDDLSRELAAGR